VVFDVEEQEFGTQAFFGQEVEAEPPHTHIRYREDGTARHPQLASSQLAPTQAGNKNQVVF